SLAAIARAGHRRELAAARAAVASDRRHHGDRHPGGAGRPEEAEGSARRGAGQDRRHHEGLMTALGRGERRFALALFLPAFAVLVLATNFPVVYLAWTSLFKLDLTTPWLSGFAGADNYVRMAGDPRFWASLKLTAIYTGTTVVLQVLVGLGLARLVMQIPRGPGMLRVPAILPIVLAPVVVGFFWRTLVLAPDFGVADFVTRALGTGIYNWLGDPDLALVSVIAIHTWQWTPFAFLVILASLSALPPEVVEAARRERATAL